MEQSNYGRQFLKQERSMQANNLSKHLVIRLSQVYAARLYWQFSHDWKFIRPANVAAHNTTYFSFLASSANEDSSSNSYNVVPTAVDWVYEDPSHMVTGFSNAACIIYDIETGKTVIRMDSMQVRSAKRNTVIWD